MRSRIVLAVPWLALAILAAVVVWLLALESSLTEARAVNLLINGVGLVLVFAALGLAVEAVEEEVQQGKMRQWTGRLLYWSPRVVALLFAGFVSLFALDVFGTGAGFWQTLLALIIHLLPVGALLVGILLAWRWEWIGALFLIGWAVWYIAMAWGQFYFSVYLLLAALPFALGLLFLLNWFYRTELHHEPQAA